MSFLIALTSTVRANDLSFSANAGYQNAYVVDGTVRAPESAAATIEAVKSLSYADVYVNGLLLASDKFDQSIWTSGAYRKFVVDKDLTLKLDGNVSRHQAGDFGIPSSTRFGVRLDAENPYVTPFVRGSFNIELEQYGVAAGLYRVFSLPLGLKLTPMAEYGVYSDYKALVGKAILSRPFDTKFGVVTPYVEAGAIHNDIDVATYNFATEQSDKKFIIAAGLNLKF